MSDFEIGFEPKLTFLSQEDKNTLYTSALKVMEETGMLVQHEGALKLLTDAGCKLGKDGMVRMPASLVEQARKTVPNNIAMYDREGNHAMDAIPQGFSQGQFLTVPHTLKHLRKVQWEPELFFRKGHDKWVEQGRTTLLDRARTKLNNILDTHQPLAIADEKQAAISKILDGFLK